MIPVILHQDIDPSDSADVPMQLIEELREAINQDRQAYDISMSTEAGENLLRWLDTH